MVLLSDAAARHLEEMARRSRLITSQRFGKTVQMFAPLYLSNECQNICTYCGFSYHNKIKRKTLTDDEIRREAKALKDIGFDHVLLVSGEANASVGMDYFLKAIPLVKEFFSNISIEFQPLETEDYRHLHDAGIYSVLVYQETYNKSLYPVYHPKGKKSNFNYRLDTPDRLGESGMHKIGLGVLLGLDNWKSDSVFCAMHLDYLQRTYWRSKYSVSFPRLRPAEGVHLPSGHISEKELLQLICAYRIVFPDVELSLSTRESPRFRDNVLNLGITSMSAGSRTNPGGYAVDVESLEQFETDDQRSLSEVMTAIAKKGYDPVLKDWDKAYS
jgi:2-iminoacetate synthase